MTRKHFQALAEALRATMPSVIDSPEHHHQWQQDVLEIELVCARMNPAFDPSKFRAACGYVCQTREEQHTAATA